jgi:hypothetical protein
MSDTQNERELKSDGATAKEKAGGKATITKFGLTETRNQYQ